MEKPRVAAKWRRSGMGSKETVATAKEKGALANEMVWRRSAGCCGGGREDGVATVGRGGVAAVGRHGVATVGRMVWRQSGGWR